MARRTVDDHGGPALRDGSHVARPPHRPQDYGVEDADEIDEATIEAVDSSEQYCLLACTRVG